MTSPSSSRVGSVAAPVPLTCTHESRSRSNRASVKGREAMSTWLNCLTRSALPLAAAALCLFGASAMVRAAETSDEPVSGVKPSPIHFSTRFGSLTFPDGTTLSITQWSHFVPRYDKWFDVYAQQWGTAHNVKVSVQHISYADLNSILAAAIAAKNGPTLMQMNATPAAFVQGLQPL